MKLLGEVEERRRKASTTTGATPAASSSSRTHHASHLSPDSHLPVGPAVRGAAGQEAGCKLGSALPPMGVSAKGAEEWTMTGAFSESDDDDLGPSDLKSPSSSGLQAGAVNQAAPLGPSAAVKDGSKSASLLDRQHRRDASSSSTAVGSPSSSDRIPRQLPPRLSVGTSSWIKSLSIRAFAVRLVKMFSDSGSATAWARGWQNTALTLASCIMVFALVAESRSIGTSVRLWWRTLREALRSMVSEILSMGLSITPNPFTHGYVPRT